MTITLNAPATLTVTPAVTFSTSELTILNIVDSPVTETVVVALAAATDTDGNVVARVTLWEGEDYAEHANFAWTLNDVEQRLAALLAR